MRLDARSVSHLVDIVQSKPRPSRAPWPAAIVP